MQFSNTVRILLLLIIIFAVIFSLTQIRITANQIERVTVKTGSPATNHPLDQLLIKNLRSLGQGRFLETLLNSKERVVEISPVALGRCQVNQGEYNAFGQWAQFNNQLHRFQTGNTPIASRFLDHKLLGRRSAPVTGINYQQAAAFCQATGGRLPTTDEWEAAAGGQEQRLYPWGNDFQNRFWRFRNPMLNVINHCEVYPESATPDGILDMGNSVSEWTTGSEGSAVLKGGNAFNRPYSLQALNSVSKPTTADFSSQFVGFRCAYDQTQPNLSQGSIISKTLPWDEQYQVVSIAPGSYTLGIPKAARVPPILQSVDQQSIPQLAPALSGSNNNFTSLSSVLSRYEITVTQYGWFLRDPLARLNYYANELQPESHNYVPNNWEQQQEMPDAPVTGVSWWDAYAFASWAGARLPTVDEWNNWYGGSQRYIYPWGDDYRKDLAIVRDPATPRHKPVPVTNSQDSNDYGITGLAGNVSEWTSSLYLGSNERSIIVKGGNFLLDGKESARVDYTARAPLYHRSPAIGFRIVFQ